MAYELVDCQTFINPDTGILEQTQIRSSSRFFKPIEEFMGTVGDNHRFERLDEDISAQIWAQSFQLVN
ncbi:hypothetical protein [Chamaesiphon sp. OTE_8_metabat_110]|uniref:hypothetical protein n=1 Tax=Chamaesiphon sp. OTE_8_metabat_110 TaxID=2964696 RepID=UPI00286A7129|nr:hypothetical protein [Chamaesiphon sp. OTE_8_metabat_110]